MARNIITSDPLSNRCRKLQRDHAPTEGRLRDLLDETLERVTGAKMRVFNLAVVTSKDITTFRDLREYTRTFASNA